MPCAVTSRHLVYDFDDAVRFHDSLRRAWATQSWALPTLCPNCLRGRHGRCGQRFPRRLRLCETGANVERVHVIPTCVEPRNYPIARQETGGEHLDLVWIGSASTLRGLEQSRPIWERLAERPSLN